MQNEETGPNAVVTALQHIRRMRGGAQSHLLRCSDGKSYVVKFRNNPQGVRILANEFIFNGLARMCGLSVPRHAIVDVGEWLIQNSPELNIQLIAHSIPCESGLQYGSEYVIDPLKGRILDWLPPEMLPKLRNRPEFCGILAFDKWSCNLDHRQAMFWRPSAKRKYSACFIDHGYCFGAGDWAFRDNPFVGTFPRNEVYCDVTGWESFDPWLSQLENLDENLIWSAAGNTPPGWYNSDLSSLEALGQTLINRRNKVRQLVGLFRDSPRNPFPRWRQKQSFGWVDTKKQKNGGKHGDAARPPD
jgi:hypothetical protein